MKTESRTLSREQATALLKKIAARPVTSAGPNVYVAKSASDENIVIRAEFLANGLVRLNFTGGSCSC